VILVAGGSGFIGSAVVRQLVTEGREVAVMSAHPERRSARLQALGVRVVPGDVLDEASLRPAVQGADAVVQSLTFPTFPVEKRAKRFTFAEFDHLGTERLVRAAAEAGVGRFVFVSGVGLAPDAPKAWHRAKWAGEEAIRATGISHANVRPSWVYGPQDRALNRFAQFHRRLPFVPVVGDGLQRLQPLFVDDLALVLARAAAPDGPTGTFEAGGPEVLTMDEVLGAMMDALGRRKPLVHVPVFLPKLAGFVAQVLPRPPLSPAAVDFLTGDAVADIGPLVEAFGIRPRALKDGLRTYLGR
jgi:uncharacterized protein YbjT (DUF2867 family)